MFYPDIAATAKVLSNLMFGLSKKGLNIKVISQNRSYLNPLIKFKKKDSVYGVDIERFSVHPFNKANLISKTFLMVESIIEIRNIIRKEYPKAFFAVSNPPFMAYFVGLEAKRKSSPFIFLVHDLYPDILLKLSFLKKNTLLFNVLQDITRKTFNLSTKIVVLGRDVKNFIVFNYDINSSKIEVIPNMGPEKKISNSMENNCEASSNTFKILYSGNIGMTAEFVTLLETAKILQKLDKNVIFFIVGDGVKKEKLLKFVHDNNLHNIKVLPYQSEENYIKLLKKSNCCFVSLAKNLYGISVPSKAYYYLSAGKPILGVLPYNSEIYCLINEENVGFAVDYNPDMLVSKIIELKNNFELYNQFSANSRNAYEFKYSPDIIEIKYISLLKEIGII